MKNFESLMRAGLEVSGKREVQYLPFDLTVISNQGKLWGEDVVAYIGIEAGSKNAFVNASCYKGYANFFVIIFKKTNEYVLQFNNMTKSWNKKISFPKGFNDEEFKDLIKEFTPYFTNNKYFIT